MATSFTTRMLRILPPEAGHGLALLALQTRSAPRRPSPSRVLGVQMCGLDLPNPIGLAAGFDKDAQVVSGALSLGFGFVEVGAVTPLAQAGNPRPRVFRLPGEGGVINRLGFNNAGVDVVAANLTQWRASQRPGVVGVNVGANKDSEDRIADYLLVLERLWGLAQYFTINVSSPNTPGLRNLQSGDAMTELLSRLRQHRQSLAEQTAMDRPVLLKVAPDLEGEAIEDIAEAVVRSGVIDGVVVSNTTISRPDGLSGAHVKEPGGLSGRPMFALSTEVLRRFARAFQGGMPLIGVGGVENGRTAYAKILAGASAVQLYTAMVYQGPSVVRQIARELEALLLSDGFASVADAVGADL